MRRIPPFSPTQISGCSIWLDASDLTTITSSAGSVSQWLDKSSNALPLLQATTANKPDTTTLAALNNMPVMAFSNATATRSMRSTATATFPAPYTMFMVFYLTSGANIMTEIGAYPSQYRYVYTGNGTLAEYSGVRAYQQGATSSVIFASNTPYIMMIADPNATTNISEITFRVNSVTSTTLNFYNASLGSGQTDNFAVIGYGSATSYVGEVIYYNQSLSVGQYQQVEGYLAQKWGMKSFLTPGHPGVTSTIYPTPRILTLIPRSYATSFTPTGVAGSTLWLDAADPAGNGTTPSNGSSLASWTDKSGNGLTVSAASSQPTYATNTLNGLGTVAFNGTQNLTAGSVTGTKLIGNTGSSAIFAVVMQSAAYRSMAYSWDDGSYTYRLILQFNGSGQLIMTEGNSAGGLVFVITGTGVITPNQYFLVSLTQNGSNATMYINGSTDGAGMTISTASSAGLTSASRTFNVGAYVNGGASSGPSDTGSWWMRGNTAEILFYNTNIPSNFQQVEGYLAWKWALQSYLPASHPYKSVSPNVTNPLNLSRPATLLNQYPTPKTTGNYRSALSLPSGIITSGLLSFFSFDNTFADTQNLITLTATGSVSYVAGRRNNAIYLANEANSANGTTATNYLTSSYTVTVPFSVSVWFNPTNTNRGSLLSTYNSVAVTSYSVNLYIASGSMSAAYNNIQNVGGTYALSTGTWYHAIITVNASNGLSFFVNGSQVGSTITQTPSLNGLMIGNIQDGGGSYPFSGYMDDFRIYNRVLSGSEITAIYNGTG